MWDYKDYAKYGRWIHELNLTFTVRQFFGSLRQTLREPSFFPEMARKSAPRRLGELLLWFCRHGEVNTFYNSYGFDVKGLRDQSQYLPYRRFRIERYNANLYVRSPYAVNRVCILRDKTLFSLYMGAAIGEQYLAGDLGRLTAEGTVLFSAGARRDPMPLAAFLQTQTVPLFIKRLSGECGFGCYSVRPDPDGGRQLTVNGSAMEPEELAQQLSGAEYIIQRQLIQHERLTRLNPSCVNTLRIVTITDKKTREPRIFARFLRLGIRAAVDNRAAGGLAVLVDEAGVCRGRGFSHHASYTEHPVTHVCFDGYQLPFWPQVQALVVQAHRALPDIQSIGWDVAITPDGPVLLEGNDDWELSGIQDTAGGVKKRWYEFTA